MSFQGPSLPMIQKTTQRSNPKARGMVSIRHRRSLRIPAATACIWCPIIAAAMAAYWKLSPPCPSAARHGLLEFWVLMYWMLWKVNSILIGVRHHFIYFMVYSWQENYEYMKMKMMTRNHQWWQVCSSWEEHPLTLGPWSQSVVGMTPCFLNHSFHIPTFMTSD